MRAFVPLMLLSSACSAGFTGTVEGRTVAVQSTFFVEDEGSDLLRVGFLEVADGCSTMADFTGASAALEPDDYDSTEAYRLATSELWNDFFPEEHWQSWLTVFVEDVESSQAGLSLTVNPTSSEVGSASLSLYDYDAADADGVQGDYFGATSGSGSLEVHRPGDALHGTLQAEVTSSPWDASAPTDTLELSWVATHCGALQDLLD